MYNVYGVELVWIQQSMEANVGYFGKSRSYLARKKILLLYSILWTTIAFSNHLNTRTRTFRKITSKVKNFNWK